jgi:hypothetical protein
MESINCDGKSTTPCNISNCVQSIKGLKSKSSSPVETVFLNFKPRTYINNILVDSAFLKIFVSPNQPNITSKSEKNILSKTQEDRIALQYEIDIYKKVSKMVKLNICPHFTLIYESAENCSYDDMTKMLVGVKTPDLKLSRSLYFMLNHLQNRPDITSSKEIKIDERDMIEGKKLQFNFSMIESMASAVNLIRAPVNFFFNERVMLPVLFQVLYTCRALYLNGITHNDLHLGNILLKQIPKTRIRYDLIDDIGVQHSYFLETDIMVYVYDYDKSYNIEGGPNKILNLKWLSSIGYKNQVIEIRDMLRIILDYFAIINVHDINDPKIRWILKSLPKDSKLAEIIYRQLDIPEGARTEKEKYNPMLYTLYKSVLQPYFFNSFEIIDNVARYMYFKNLIGINLKNVKVDAVFTLDPKDFKNGKLLNENIRNDDDNRNFNINIDRTYFNDRTLLEQNKELRKALRCIGNINPIKSSNVNVTLDVMDDVNLRSCKNNWNTEKFRIQVGIIIFIIKTCNIPIKKIKGNENNKDMWNILFQYQNQILNYLETK